MLFRLVIWRVLPGGNQILFQNQGGTAFPTPQVGNRMELHPPNRPPLTLVVREVTFAITATEIVTSILCQ